MTTEAKGFGMGWGDAARYATGTRADRRAVRRRLAKSAASWTPFWLSYRQACLPRLEAFAVAIAEGRLPRTCRPSRMFYVTNHD